MSHELGHNIGALHTHECVWDASWNYNFSGGAIDNCNMYSSLFDAESSCYGEPSSIFLSSTYDYGTIMSYCHVTSLVPLYLEFHPIVQSQALIPGLENSCLIGNCIELSYECGAPLNDQDGDGVLDDEDNCIDNLSLIRVDNNSCPKNRFLSDSVNVG